MRLKIFLVFMTILSLAFSKRPKALTRPVQTGSLETLESSIYLDPFGQSNIKYLKNGMKNIKKIKKTTTSKNKLSFKNPEFKIDRKMEAFDWRELGFVTPVKDQHNCGSSYAFSVISAIESQLLIHRNLTLDLSEQNIIDCDTNSFKCNGGTLSSALEFAKNFGLNNENSYPYTGTSGKCESNQDVVKISGYVSVLINELQEALVKNGPIVSGVYVGDKFLNYVNGTVLSENCRRLNHAVLIVGFNNTANPPYWIIKNSWGTLWGDDGFAKIQKGRLNSCIGLLSYFPIL